MTLYTEAVISEKQMPGSVWRMATQKWLEEFLDNGGQITHGDRFISFSYDDIAGGQDNFGDREIVIEFDENEILKQVKKQGLEPVDYTTEWFDVYPEVCKYITGYNGEKDYYEDKDLSGPEEANEKFELTWENYLEDFMTEQEIVLKKLKYTPKLIKNVIFEKEANQSLVNKLKRNNINIQMKTGLKDDPQLRMEI